MGARDDDYKSEKESMMLDEFSGNQTCFLKQRKKILRHKVCLMS